MPTLKKSGGYGYGTGVGANNNSTTQALICRKLLGDENGSDLATLNLPDGPQAVNLAGTQITDAGLKRARSSKCVVLSHTEITEAGLETIKQLEYVSHVDLEHCPNISRKANLDLVRYFAPHSRTHQHERRMQTVNRGIH